MNHDTNMHKAARCAVVAAVLTVEVTFVSLLAISLINFVFPII